MPKAQSELQLKDINFLKAVRELCDNPDEHPHTDKGKAPANTTALKQIDWLDLTEGDLEYRMVKQDDSSVDKRGFEVNGGLGYLRIHRAEPGPSGYEPRSVEITDKGRKALKAAMEKHGLVDTPTEESGTVPSQVELQLETLRERNQELEQQVDSLQAEVSELREEREEFVRSIESVEEMVSMWEERSWGAINQEESEKINSTVRAIPAFVDIFTAVFGLDPKNFGLDTEVTEEDVTRAREQVRSAVNGDMPAQPGKEN